MADKELTESEKCILLGHLDADHRDDINQELYDLMENTRTLVPSAMNDQVRRTIQTWADKLIPIIEILEDGFKDDGKVGIGTALMIGWLNGFQVAKKWKGTIATTPGSTKKK